MIEDKLHCIFARQFEYEFRTTPAKQIDSLLESLYEEQEKESRDKYSTTENVDVSNEKHTSDESE